MKHPFSLLCIALLLAGPLSPAAAGTPPEKKPDTAEKAPAAKPGVTCSRDPETGINICTGSFSSFAPSGGLCCHYDMRTGEKYCH